LKRSAGVVSSEKTDLVTSLRADVANFSNLIAQGKLNPLSQVKEAFEALSIRHTLARSF
jgi:hypothetical protein